MLASLVHLACRLLHAGQPVGDPASRRGKWKDLQHKQPSYEKLQQHLSKKEWPANAYEAQYWEEIYSVSKVGGSD